ncbi:hypothetical protein Dsin_009026 [Dipteronia sinensis]|uniref:Reverse transcriptase domain-containing protein n=1 Tax=Dipteronia sinensis TaxID=43782 RepID=A0AAE0APT6_9ROSI|nr:hypothetical protein Dsin_009026 [Dipteronia sinensis]
MVILKKWHPKLILTKASYSKILVWVKLFNIPNEYWIEKGLSRIASAVGKPLYADSLTESMKRISYARICIEIDATYDLVDSFDSFMGDKSDTNHDKSVEILVEYKWKPKICSECKSFGHSIVTCPRLKPLHPPSDTDFAPKPKQEWRRINRRDNPLVPSPQANLEPLLPLATLKGDEVIPTCSSEIEPSSCHTVLPIHNKSNGLPLESVVDTCNKFSALYKDGDYCNDDDSLSTTSLDHSLWHSKIKNIDGVMIIGLSSPTESSSNTKKKKKWTAKKGKDNSSQAQFQISFVYGSNVDRSRRAIWQSMCSSLHGSPWIVLGDFNALGGWMSQLGVAPEFLVLWRSSMTVFNLQSLMIFVSQEQVHGTLQYKLCSKLRNLKKVLKALNKEKNSRKDLISCYMSTLKAEKDLLRQKSRIQWLKAGDRNSLYFFKAINGKRNRSKIHSITGDDGSLIEGDNLVKNEAIRHFQTILGCSMPARHGIGSTLSNIIDKVISNDQADFMGRDVTNDEIREVCFSLHPNKAPGLDGLNAHFFKKTWDIVCEDVISVVQEFFSAGRLLKELNATILALFPKVPNPSKMKDFRPISCCNTLYKIIAKIIANRIKPCLLDIICPSQSAFVAGRSIGDNILLVQ